MMLFLPYQITNNSWKWWIWTKTRDKKQQDKGLNDEIDFTRLKDQIDSGEKITDIELLKDIEFYFGGPSPNFLFNVFKLEFK